MTSIQTPACSGGYRILVASPDKTDDLKSAIGFEEVPVAQWLPVDKGGVFESMPMILDEELGAATEVEWFLLSRSGPCAVAVVLGPDSPLSAIDVKTLEDKVRKKQLSRIVYLQSDACRVERERIKKQFVRYQACQRRLQSSNQGQV